VVSAAGADSQICFAESLCPGSSALPALLVSYSHEALHRLSAVPADEVNPQSKGSWVPHDLRVPDVFPRWAVIQAVAVGALLVA